MDGVLSVLNWGRACLRHPGTANVRHPVCPDDRAWASNPRVGGILPCSLPMCLQMGSGDSLPVVSTPLHHHTPPLIPNRADLCNL